MNSSRVIFLFLFQISTVLFGLDVKACYVSDETKHKSNQKILKAILKQELISFGAKKTPTEKAAYLSSRISEIAKTLLQKGFALEAYQNPEADPNSLLSFDCFALWEGDSNGSIPLTFFVYVWPSEEYAFTYNSSHPRNSYYSSIIHSHPISCAFAVMDGTLLQKNYELVSSHAMNKVVRLTDEEVFQKCEGSVDDLKQPFIHQLYSKGTGSKPSLSLHVYGLPSEEKVMASFRETSSLHSYNSVLQKDGIVKIIPSSESEKVSN